MRLLVCVLVFFISVSLDAKDRSGQPSAVKPERVGMSAERLGRIDDLTERYVANNQLAGVVTLVARKGKVVYFKAHGHRGVDDETKLNKDALFRIYSMSKPISAVAAMMLYEQGHFQLSDPITKFLPELEGLEVVSGDEMVALEKAPTMRELLTHTAGFSYGFTRNNVVDVAYQDDQIFLAKDLDEFVARLAKIPLLYSPGEKWHYSIASDLLGAVVERISGQSFDVYLKEKIFDPLGMNDTFFDIPADKKSRFLPSTAWDPKNKRMVPFVEKGYPLYENTTLFSGGGGLVSSAVDYLKFSEMLRRGGEYNGIRLLGPKTVKLMTQDHLPGTLAGPGNGENPVGAALGEFARGTGFGLGVAVVTNPAASGIPISTGAFSWGGAAGTIFWVDPVEEMVVIAMIQQMGSPWPLRQELIVLTNQAILESYE